MKKIFFLTFYCYNIFHIYLAALPNPGVLLQHELTQAMILHSCIFLLSFFSTLLSLGVCIRFSVRCSVWKFGFNSVLVHFFRNRTELNYVENWIDRTELISVRFCTIRFGPNCVLGSNNQPPISEFFFFFKNKLISFVNNKSVF